MKTYRPRPIDTAQVELPPDLGPLVELLARNAHDVWARARIAEGWRHGPRRDDTARRHPCLVPYESLPRSEADYDRNSVIETLKAVVSLGYSVVPPRVYGKRAVAAPTRKARGRPAARRRTRPA